VQFVKGYLVKIGTSDNIKQPILSPAESLSCFPPEQCESLIKIKAYPDFLIITTKTRFLDVAIDFIARIDRNAIPERFFPIFLIIHDSELLLFKFNRICVILPEDLGQYRMLLSAYNAGADAVDSSIDNLKIYGFKIVKFYQNYKKISAFKHLALKTDPDKAILDYLFQVSELVETYDNYPVSHIRLMGRLAFDICKTLGYSDQDSKEIAQAIKLHDIGKLFVPKQLLGASVVVSRPEEWEIYHRHTSEGAKFVKRMLTQKNNLYTKIANVILYHHENYNGSGYPTGIKGSNIPIEARIARVLDIFDSLQRERAYRKEKIEQKALRATILESSGEIFDPEIVNALIKVLSMHTPHQFSSVPAESVFYQSHHD